MKQLFLIVFLAMQVGGAHAAKQYRDFTDTQGRTIRGCVLAYNVKTGVVSFERSNRRTAKVPLSVFSEESQQQIVSWQIKKHFTSNSSFKISATRHETKNEQMSMNGYKTLQRAEDASYKITLENKSKTNFKNIKIEYCIYYEQETSAESTSVPAEKGVLCGSFSDLSIASNSKQTLESDVVIIYKATLNAENYYSTSGKSKLNGEVIGIWMRIHTKLPSGEKVIREYSRPDKIIENHKWAKSSMAVGLNQTTKKQK